MDFITVCGLALLCLVCLRLLSHLREDYARFLSAGAACLFLPIGISRLKEYFQHYAQLSQSLGVFPYGELLLKAVGIAFLGSTVSTLCRDCSESSLGEKVQFCTRCSILALSLPVVKDLTEQALGLL